MKILQTINKLKISTFVFLHLSVPKAKAALLDEIKNKTITTGKTAGFDVDRDPRESVALMINGLLGFLGIIFTALIIYAGWQWMTAGGNEERVSKAKKTITNSTIGLILVIVAYAISVWIFKVIEKSVGADAPPPPANP